MTIILSIQIVHLSQKLAKKSKEILQITNLIILYGTKYAKNYCIEIFNRNNLKKLVLNEITNTFIRINTFRLKFDNNSISDSENSSLSSLEIELYNVEFTSEIYNKILFYNLQRIAIRGNIKKFERNIFDASSFTDIILNINNLRQVLHSSSDFFQDIFSINQYNSGTQPTIYF